MAFNIVLRVHPVVLFEIVDAYERRNMDADRVIGTLLGTIEKGVVEASHSFCVPHNEYDENVEAELSYATAMFEINQKVRKQEVVVGWWATGRYVTRHSSVIHEYYSRECQNPIHMTLDTTLEDNRMALNAYINVSFGVPGGKMGSMFHSIPVEVVCHDQEFLALDLFDKTVSVKPKVVKPMDEVDQILEKTNHLIELVDGMLTYVDGVISGKKKADNDIGRTLINMVNSVPKLTPEQFQHMLNNNLKDLLMVMSLSQMIHMQLQFNEKLTFLTSL